MLTLRKASTWALEKNTTTALKEALPHTCAEELGIVYSAHACLLLLLANSSHLLMQPRYPRQFHSSSTSPPKRKKP